MGVLASLGAVLTLPGIAGIVLSLGMSVDANVLIYERIREELSAGKSARLAITEGFKKAMPSILDSNITTFLDDFPSMIDMVAQKSFILTLMVSTELSSETFINILG